MNFKEEARLKAEKVRKAIVEGRVISFRFSKDGSCEFNYKGIDHHGLECEFLSTLNQENTIIALSGLKMNFDRTAEQPQTLTRLERTTRLCELVAELKATEEQIQAIRVHTQQIIEDEQE
jgi:hypothetical protein